MFSAIFWIDVVISAALAILGLLVLIRNNHIALHRIFFLFATSLACWIMANFFSNNQDLTLTQALIANHLTLFFPGLAMLFMLMFVGTLTKSQFYMMHRAAIVGLSLVAYTFTLTPLVVKSIERQSDVYAITFGVLAPLYFGWIVATMATALAVLGKGKEHSRGTERTRLSIIWWSILGALFFNLITNILLPVLGGSFLLTNLGPISVSLIVGGLFYSIARHQLFDIRFVVARSVGYVLSLTALGLLYGAAAFLVIGGIVYRDTSLNINQLALFACLAAITTLAFQPLRRFFDVFTRKVFYKDSYDPQAFLDEFNRVLVGSLGIESLLTNSARVIIDSLKVSSCSFIIGEVGGRGPKVFGVEKVSFSKADLEIFEREASSQKEAVIITDFLESRHALKTILVDKNIALTAVLQANQVHGVLGYMTLGLKKSGSPYNSQDMKLIDIVASELVIAIQNNLRFEEIQLFNITLEQKIEEATRKLRQTNDKLRKLDETKDDFISMASHQLRTPLTSVKGYVSMVLDGDAGKITGLQRKLLTQSFVSSQRMVYLISDLLNVSRLKTGRFVIEPVASNLARVIEEEVSQLIETVKGRGLQLTYHKPEHFPTLMLDETKLRQVIMNFIDNAVYYTPSGGHIDVYLVDKPQSIEFTVVDDGIGVPRHEQHHLFSKFFRAHNAKRARPDGTGLGIFMAKKVIIAQGGAVIFRSTEGKGSTFGFTFPKSKLLPASSKTPPKDDKKPPK